MQQSGEAKNNSFTNKKKKKLLLIIPSLVGPTKLFPTMEIQGNYPEFDVVPQYCFMVGRRYGSVSNMLMRRLTKSIKHIVRFSHKQKTSTCIYKRTSLSPSPFSSASSHPFSLLYLSPSELPCQNPFASLATTISLRSPSIAAPCPPGLYIKLFDFLNGLKLKRKRRKYGNPNVKEGSRSSNFKPVD